MKGRNKFEYIPAEIEKFVYRIPEILSIYPSTIELAHKINELNISQIFQFKFTLAIAGQMKAAKSTLLNSLIRQDLAPVGVNECTATVNRFVYFNEIKNSKFFRVYWKNGDTKDVPIENISSWIGVGDNVNETLRLDFFSSSEFLQNVNIIDTPGLRSTIDIHENNAKRILNSEIDEEKAKEMEVVSVKHGEQADAIIYVLNPVGKENDQKMLDLFGEHSRLPGASAYNSIAVIQKWEHLWLDLDEDITAEVDAKCRRLKKQLEGMVVDVIPVSGLLARCLDWLTDFLWVKILHLSKSPTSVIKELTFGQEFFLEDEIDDSTIDLLGRQEMYLEILECIKSEIDEHAAKATCWTLVSFLLKLSHKFHCSDVEDLKKLTLKFSGINKLKSILTTRFFKKSSLIKAGKVLNKTWEPCEIGLTQLEILVSDRREAVENGEKILSILNKKNQDDKDLDIVYSYVTKNAEALKESLNTLISHQKELYSIKSRLKKFFGTFDDDLIALELLESNLIKDVVKQKELKALFGGNGLSPFARLGFVERPNSSEIMIEQAQQKLRFWAHKENESFGNSEKLCRLAQKRLKEILDDLEQ